MNKPSESDAAIMAAQYTLLISKLLNACNGNNPHVAIAALLGAAGTVAVQTFETDRDARNYLFACANDVGDKLLPAFKQKTQDRIQEGHEKVNGNGKSQDD